MASDHFIDPILQQVCDAGGAALVGTSNVLVDTGAQEAADSTGNSATACLPALSVGASSMSGVIQLYNKETRSQEKTAGGRPSGRIEQAVEAVVNDLQDRVGLYKDILRQFADDPSRWAEETKIFQRDIGTLLKRLSNTMFRGHICLNAMRVWANGAAFHIQIISLMTNAGLQTSESLLIAAEIHRETAMNLCSEYWRSSQLSEKGAEIREVEKYFHCSSNFVERPTNQRTNVVISEVAGAFDKMLDETPETRGHENEDPASPSYFWLAFGAVLVLSAIIYYASIPSPLDQTKIVARR